MDSNFNIKLSATINDKYLKSSIESFFAKNTFKIKVALDTSSISATGTTSSSKSSGSVSASAKQMTTASRAVDDFQVKLNNLKVTGGLTDKQFTQFNTTLGSINTEFQKTKNVDAFNTSMHKLKNEVSEATTKTKAMGQSIGDVILKFTEWYLIAGGVTAIINGLKNVVAQVKLLDDAMVDLKKVYDGSSLSMSEVKEQAFEIADALSSTGEEVINATTEFKRMGYTIEESLNLAKVAIMLSNVSENIDDTGEAATILTSIMKGLGVSSEYAMSILDRLNEVSNTQAVSFDALADMAQESAATMKILGNNFDETLGLITGGYEVLQDEKVAKGIQTIGLRIAGLNEDMESVAGLSNEVVEALQKYAGVNAFDEQTGQIKSTYDIMKELAGVYDTLSKNEQSALLNTLAGKQRADVAAAILSNWEGVEKAVESASNSMGSAQQEQESYAESIEASMNRLANAVQKFSDALVDSGVVTFFVDVATAVMEVIGGFTSFISGAPKWIKWMIAIGAGIGALVVAVMALKGALKGLVGLIAGLAGATTALAAIAAASGLAKDAMNEATSTITETGADLAETYEDAEESVSDYDVAVNKLKNSISDLNSELSDELELLQEQNEKVNQERQLEEKLLSVEKARQALAEAKHQKARVYRVGQGMVYASDASEVQSAQETLNETLNDLSEYKYDLALDRAEEFVDALTELLNSDDITEGWADLFDNFSDLLDTEFASYVLKAQEFVQTFNGTVGADNAISLNSVASATGSSISGLSSSSSSGLSLGSSYSNPSSYVTSSVGSSGGTSISIGTLTLSNVQDVDSFITELTNIAVYSKPRLG